MARRFPSFAQHPITVLAIHPLPAAHNEPRRFHIVATAVSYERCLPSRKIFRADAFAYLQREPHE